MHAKKCCPLDCDANQPDLERQAGKKSLKVWSHLPLFGKISQAKSSHSNRNPCNWVFRTRAKKIPHTGFAHFQVGHSNSLGLKQTLYISMLLTMNLFLHAKFHLHFANVTEP